MAVTWPLLHPNGNLCLLGNGRYAVTYGRYKPVTVSLPRRPRNGRVTSETAVRRFQKRSRHLDPEVVLKLKNPRGYRNFYKIPQG